MILIIDDLKTFEFPKDVEVVYARTLDEARNQLFAGNQIDELWLDHDLGGEDTIRPICLHLASEAFNGRPYLIGKIVICSINPVGVKWIRSTLEKWYLVEALSLQ